jgi:hypothetical protein
MDRLNDRRPGQESGQLASKNGIEVDNFADNFAWSEPAGIKR